MISFYGSKWRTIPKYPAPLHDVIIEPFAGGASYSLRNFERQVVLNDKDPIVFGVWDYLIRTSGDEIRKLPLDVQSVDDLSVTQEAKWLIGFWLNKAVASPVKQPSAWMRKCANEGWSTKQFWCESIRERVACQADKIKHWKVFNRDFISIPNFECTWFIDPPYQDKGRHYRFSDIDFPCLAEWSKARAGQVIVCEQTGATWLNFSHLVNAQSILGRSSEVIWCSGNP